jgi:hypothetical protein
LARGVAGEQVVALLDNDPAKHGTQVDGYPVLAPSELAQLAFTRIRIASTETNTIRRQLLALGVPEERICAPLLEPENRRRLASLQGKHTGQPAVIVGNGPSLRLEDLRTLHGVSDLVTFAFNKIYLAYDQVCFRPTYYLVEDFLVAENNAAAIDGVRGSTKLFPETLLRWVHQDENTVLFGLTHRLLPDAESLFSQDPFDFKWGSSVVHTAIQWAFYLGCDPVYLIGVDFRFDIADAAAGPVLTGKGECNHFHPDYRPAGERWNRPMLELTRHAYAAAQAYAESTGRRIFNATRGGALEVFPRVAFDAAFASCSQP